MFDWSGYLELARKLGQDSRESYGRAAISRAYYAAFHHARLFVEHSTSTRMASDGRAHDQVPDELRRMRPPKLRAVNQLRDLKKLRTWADYGGNEKSNLPSEVEKALAYAEQVIKALA
jgi:hypothetical protein